MLFRSENLTGASAGTSDAFTFEELGSLTGTVDGGAGSFDGAYAGLSLGYVAGEDTGHETPVNPVEGAYSQQTNPNGELLSLAVGYDHRLAERYVVGLAVEGEMRNLGEHSVQRLNGVATARASLGYEDPIRFSSNVAVHAGPRFGYLLNGGKTALLGSVGATAARITRSFGCVGNCGFPPGNVTSVTQTDWQAGWAAGVSLEQFVTPQLTAGIDYRHAGFGEQDVNVGALYNPVAREHQEYSEDAVRFTVRYRF